MYSKTKTNRSTADLLKNISRINEEIERADAIVIGAGAGLSAASGFDYDGERFHQHFADFETKYGITDMYSGGFYPFQTLEEYWAWWSRHILINRYDNPPGKPYLNLYELVKDKDYFVITTNVDHQFQKAGFDKKRLFYTQGDYGLFQCSIPCLNETVENEDLIRQMVKEQKDMKIPSDLVPRCPHCHQPMTVNLRKDSRFVEDEGWRQAAKRYREFLEKSNQRGKKVLFLELGVGGNTPSIIKYPFWKMTAENLNAHLVSISKDGFPVPSLIRKQSLIVNEDLSNVLESLVSEPDSRKTK